MLQCINCGAKQAQRQPENIICLKCGYSWTYEQEQEMKVRIRKLYQRDPAVPPVPEPIVSDDDETIDGDETERAAPPLVEDALDDLKRIPDIGDKKAIKLYNGDLRTVEAVASATPKKVAGILDIKTESALDIVRNANTVLNELED